MTLIKCTHCGKQTNNKRDKCLLCGKEIPEYLRLKEEISIKEKVKLDKPSVEEMPKRNTKNCPFCFEEILKEAKKCKFCHEYLDKSNNPKNITKPWYKTIWGIWFQLVAWPLGMYMMFKVPYFNKTTRYIIAVSFLYCLIMWTSGYYEKTDAGKETIQRNMGY
jgi:hypothetical protein